MSFMKNDKIASKLGNVRVETSIKPNKHYYIFTALDSKYFKYCLNMIKTFHYHNPKSFYKFVFYAINLKDEQTQKLLDVCPNCLLLSDDKQFANVKEKRNYIVCYRYYKIYELLESMNNIEHILFTDCDNLFIGSIDNFHNILSNYDLILGKRPSKYENTRKETIGGFLALRNTESAQLFFGEYNNLLHNENAAWFLDQRLLGRCIRKFDNRINWLNFYNTDYVDEFLRMFWKSGKESEEYKKIVQSCK